MTSYAKIQWTHGYTYYGQTKDGSAFGKGLVTPPPAGQLDTSGLIKVTKLTGTFDGIVISDAVFEFERHGIPYTFAGETNGLCLVKGTLECKTGPIWSFTGTFEGMKLVSGVLKHPMLKVSVCAQVTNINISYEKIFDITTIAQLLIQADDGAVVALRDGTYTTPSRVVSTFVDYIYDGEYSIVGDNPVCTGKGKKVYVKSGAVVEGEFVDNVLQKGTLVVGGVKISISGQWESGYTIGSELFE